MKEKTENRIRTRLSRAAGWLDIHADRLLLVLLALQAIGLVVTLLCVGVLTVGDSPSYIAPAESFLQSGVMRDTHGAPILQRTPGYPFLLAMIYAVTGGSNLAVVFVQMGMALAVTFLLFRVVGSLTRPCLGLAAALFYIADFAVYSAAVSILTDLPFAFLLTLALFLLTKRLQTGESRYLVGCFALLQVAMLFRPTILYFNLLLAAVLLVFSLLRRLSWKTTGVYLLLLLVVLGGWTARNAVRFGRPVFTTIREESTYLYYAPELYAQENDISFDEAMAHFEAQLEEQYPDFDRLPRMEQVDAYRQIGSTYLRAHPLGYLRMNVLGLFKEMVGPDSDTIDALPLPAALRTLCKLGVAGMLLLSYLLYAVGFFANLRRLRWLDWLLLLTTMYLMASTAVLGYSRFRLAFYPTSLTGTFLCLRTRAFAAPKPKPEPAQPNEAAGEASR